MHAPSAPRSHSVQIQTPPIRWWHLIRYRAARQRWRADRRYAKIPVSPEPFRINDEPMRVDLGDRGLDWWLGSNEPTT